MRTRLDGSRGERRSVVAGGWLPALAAVLVLGAVIGGCATGEELVTLPGQGYAAGRVYLDWDGDREPGGPDQALQNVGVRLVVAGTIDTLVRVASDPNGNFVFGSVPIGRYTIAVPDAAIFGDSLEVVRIDAADLSIGVNDTAQVNVAISFPSFTALATRSLALGRKIFVEGTALNSSPTFGDSSVNIRDTTGAIRITNARGPAVTTGDSVRFLGRVEGVNGQPVISAGQAILLQIGGAPVPVRTTTAEAAAGTLALPSDLDAELVRVVDVTIGSDTATVAEGYQFSVNDGSGALVVLLDADAGLTRTPFVPGAVIDATGVLRPEGTGIWRLKPRVNTDLVVK